MDDEPLTNDEVRTLKEFAKDIAAMGRVRRYLTAALLWVAGVLVAGWVIWDKFISHIKWNT